MKNKQTEPLTQQDYKSLATFRYTLRRFLRFSEEAATSTGLTAQQYQALLAIKGAEEPPSIGFLAEQLQLRHHSTVELVNRLTDRGLILRKPSDEDRRKVQLILTADGNRKLSQLASVHREELRKVGPRIQELLKHLNQS